MTDIRDQLDQIKARADQATPGPWITWKEFPFSKPSVCTDDGQEVIGECPDDLNAASYEEPDAVFIAHASTDVPRLTEALEKVLDLANAFNRVATRLYHDGSQVDIAQGDVLVDTARDIRRTITHALTEEGS